MVTSAGDSSTLAENLVEAPLMSCTSWLRPILIQPTISGIVVEAKLYLGWLRPHSQEVGGCHDVE